MAPHYGSPNADQVLAMSCTVVGVGPGGNTSMVARVSICDFRGAILLECYVVPTMAVTDYRTSTTGITPAHLSSRKPPPPQNPKSYFAFKVDLELTRHPCKATATKFTDVQRNVADIIKDKVIVGHSLWNDLSGRSPWHMFQEAVATGGNWRFPYSVLGIPHPAVNTRDVALYQPFRNALRSPNQLVRLPTLTFHLMGRRCQESQQNPMENARAALDLYRSHANEWESAIRDGQWPSALPPSSFSRCYL
ncbi:hypothetical protein BJV78DRAFT_39591 [Lactifluus subvellereus]|nr:hypothetical protein BJV78DRAFT_39591 [Lactifluus subvellereus]